jgi:hypothetical protein
MNLYELVNDHDVCFDEVRANTVEEAKAWFIKDWGCIPEGRFIKAIEECCTND